MARSHPPRPAGNEHQDFKVAIRHHEAGRLARAESIYRNILQDNPQDGEALRMLGLLAYQTGNRDQATMLIAKAIGINGDDAAAYFHLGNILHDEGRPDEAVAAYRDALRIKPDLFPALVNLGNSQLAADRYEEAIRSSRYALEQDPNCAQALSNLGQALSKCGRLAEAVRVLERAVYNLPEKAADKSEHLNNLGLARQWVGDLEGANRSFNDALKRNPDCRLAERNLLINVLNQPGQSTEDLFTLHQEYGRRHKKSGIVSTKFDKRSKDPQRKLRVAYLSSDFHAHPVGFNVLPLLSNHDRENFEVHIYAEIEKSDEITNEFLRLADFWTSTRNMGDTEVSEKIEADEIDILVCLAGRFNLNRPLVASYRAAPIQISYHDCATSGLDEMDYWLTDGQLNPSDTEEKFSEELYRLPVFYQYQPPDDFPDPGPPPSVENGYVTFGCFNKPEKITDQVIALWSDILAAVPDSRLLLKNRNYFGDQELNAAWREKLLHFGILSDRLTLLTGDDNRADHLSLYRQIDIALDPFPFNGATTTFEALAMGVPVVALEGRRFVDRVGITLLSQMGMQDLTATNFGHYLKIARNLAHDENLLRHLREELRNRLTASPLCDNSNYALSVENAYRELWEKWCV